MSMINVSNLTFSYDGSYDNVFENVSFKIDTDWKLGFIGRNGRGKTTFLNLLMEKYSYSGTISKDDVEFEYFPFAVKDMSKCAIEVMQETCPYADDWEFLKETSLLDVDAQMLYQPFKTLSEGERTKVLLAALFLSPNKFMLIDEPTNHLDADARIKVGEYLRRKKGFILVSHDRALLDSCTDHILSINRTDIEIQQGNFSSWWKNKQLKDEFEYSQNEKLKKEIGRLEQAAKQTAAWSDKVEKSKTGSGSKIDRGYVGHKSAKLMKRAKNQQSRMLDAANEKAKLLKNTEISDSLKITALQYINNVLVNANSLSLFYDETPICQDITFQIKQGDRIALKGKNGCGKSTLLKLLCGDKIKHSGKLEVGNNLKISYVSQDTSCLNGSLSDYAKKYDIDESIFKTILIKMGFERVQFEKNIESLSSGQKKKVLIARSLCEKAHLYVWDEPLNFIDVISRIQIEELLLEYKPTMIFVEHDTVFQNSIATGEVLLSRSRIFNCKL